MDKEQIMKRLKYDKNDYIKDIEKFKNKYNGYDVYVVRFIEKFYGFPHLVLNKGTDIKETANLESLKVLGELRKQGEFD